MAGSGCTRGGVCGKSPVLSDMQDLLVWVTKGLGAVTTQLRKEKKDIPGHVNGLIRGNLCATMTHACFDTDAVRERVTETLEMSAALLPQLKAPEEMPEAASWDGTPDMYADKAQTVGPQTAADEDIRSFRELITYAVKGIAAMQEQAAALGTEDTDIDIFIQRALGQCLDDRMTGGNLLALAMEAGRYGIRSMDALDRGRTERFGTPERTEVTVGEVRPGAGILVTGSGMQELQELLEQTKDSGVSVYTHGDLLAAHAYPAFRGYAHLAGHYGGSWRGQKEDFERFRGPVLVTSEGVMIPKSSYRDRMYTTGAVRIPGCVHIDTAEDGRRDYAALIRQAAGCAGPEAAGTGTFVTGCGHEELFRLADAAAEGIRSGQIARIAVIAGDDGRAKKREYYTDLVKAMPKDVLILTAGSVQYRFPEVNGMAAGLPRVHGAGELADIYSVIQFALRLRETMELDDLNLLPMFFSLSWHGQKAAAVLMSLLYLDIKHITIGPSMPAFLSENVRSLFTGYFGLKTVTTVQEDLSSALGEVTEWITEDMIVGDIVRSYPSLVPVMASVGLHCIGCGVSQIETLREACVTHGLDIRKVREILNEDLRGRLAGGA